MKVLNILCEGPTEELFVKKVLKDYLRTNGVVVKTRLLLTSKKHNARGGIVSYQQVKRDLYSWRKENAGKKNEKHFYTMMVDFYALPMDFPEYAEAMKVADVYLRVEKLEKALQEDVNILGFIPYIQLHEYEALVFCGLEFLRERHEGVEKAVRILQKALADFGGNSEYVDGGWDTAPSRRIVNELARVSCRYNKPEDGAYVASRVGLKDLRERCRHFDSWMQQLDLVVK